jgi:hypothetical protein
MNKIKKLVQMFWHLLTKLHPIILTTLCYYKGVIPFKHGWKHMDEIILLVLGFVPVVFPSSKKNIFKEVIACIF